MIWKLALYLIWLTTQIQPSIEKFMNYDDININRSNKLIFCIYQNKTISCWSIPLAPRNSFPSHHRDYYKNTKLSLLISLNSHSDCHNKAIYLRSRKISPFKLDSYYYYAIYNIYYTTFFLHMHHISHLLVLKMLTSCRDATWTQSH